VTFVYTLACIQSANGAEYDNQGQARAKRSASPLVRSIKGKTEA